ncbi:MAG: HEPN domain-containing protein [Planctomycetota bacterium]
MPSNARIAFDANTADVRRLLDLHRDIAKDTPGRKYGVEVLNKSAVVLVCSFWEAYCEDIAAGGLGHLADYATKAESLPLEIQKRLAKDLKADEHELAVWKLAGEGWRECLKIRLGRLKAERDRRLNTPKTDQINQLFLDAVGIEKISSSWRFPGRSTSKSAEKLDAYVTLRSEIAHRGSTTDSAQKDAASNFFKLVQDLAAKTGGEVNKVVKKAAGKPLWKKG